MEIEVSNRIKSICYKENNIFRKYYRYSNDPSVDREGRLATIFYKNNLPVAKHIKTDFSEERHLRFNEFEYIDIDEIREYEIDNTLCEKVKILINKIQSIECVNDNYWETWYKDDLKKPLDYSLHLKKDSLEIIEEISNYPQKMIHGDFSLKNFGYKHNTKDLFLFDFQSSCYGPENWDFAYFLSTIDPKYSQFFEIDNHTLKMIKLITAVRLGRGSRRGIELEKRTKIQQYWWGI